jgi:hypothetical protein
MKVKLEVTLEVLKVADHALNCKEKAKDPLVQIACEGAKEGVEEALNHAMNRGFNHRHSDDICIVLEKVKVVQAGRYKTDKAGRIRPRGLKVD